MVGEKFVQVTAVPRQPFRWIAGDLALDFHNTVAWSDERNPSEHLPLADGERLTCYAHLVAWSSEAGILTERETELLLDEADRHPEDVARVLSSALELRGAIHEIFVSISRQREPQPSSLATLNALLSDALARTRLAISGDTCAWEWIGAGAAPARPLWTIVRSAADLLTSSSVRRVKVCGGQRCGALFLDTSKRGRQWCDMANCGNRAKARRHYERTRELRV